MLGYRVQGPLKIVGLDCYYLKRLLFLDNMLPVFLPKFNGSCFTVRGLDKMGP